MAMADLKTRPTRKSVEKFISHIEHPTRLQDAQTLCVLLEKLTHKKPVIWGDSIVGFGQYEYSNSKGTYHWPVIGFSPRKQSMTVYIMPGFDDLSDQLSKLGKAKTARSCLYINKLADIDIEVLKNLCDTAIQTMHQRYHCS
jgi:hypothetical protein